MESTVKIYSNGWVATILTGKASPEGFFNIYATTIGETKEDALAGAEYVLNAFAFGRLAFIRVAPKAHSDFDFDTKLTRNNGIVRLSYKLEAGEWHYPEINTVIPGFGSAA